MVCATGEERVELLLVIKRVGGGGWHHREGVETVGEYCKKPVQKPVNYLDYVFAKQREKAHRLQKLNLFVEICIYALFVALRCIR